MDVRSTARSRAIIAHTERDVAMDKFRRHDVIRRAFLVAYCSALRRRRIVGCRASSSGRLAVSWGTNNRHHAELIQFQCFKWFREAVIELSVEMYPQFGLNSLQFVTILSLCSQPLLEYALGWCSMLVAIGLSTIYAQSLLKPSLKCCF